jgi:hypothetical protein
LSDIHDFGIYYFKISEEPKSTTKLKKESGSPSVVEETLGGLKVIKVTMLSLI